MGLRLAAPCSLDAIGHRAPDIAATKQIEAMAGVTPAKRTDVLVCSVLPLLRLLPATRVRPRSNRTSVPIRLHVLDAAPYL
jgi:hypothetical protein